MRDLIDVIPDCRQFSKHVYILFWWLFANPNALNQIADKRVNT